MDYYLFKLSRILLREHWILEREHKLEYELQVEFFNQKKGGRMNDERVHNDQLIIFGEEKNVGGRLTLLKKWMNINHAILWDEIEIFVRLILLCHCANSGVTRTHWGRCEILCLNINITAPIITWYQQKLFHRLKKRIRKEIIAIKKIKPSSYHLLISN